MTLRTRLYLILGALFLVPILVGGLILVFFVPGIRNDRVRDSVRGASAAVQAEITAECQQLSLASTVVALSSSTLPPSRMFAPLRGNGIDYAALLAPDGTVRDSTGRLPAGVDPATLPDCVTGKATGAVLSRPVEVAGGASPGLRAVTARLLDTRRLDRLAKRTGRSNVALLLTGGRLVAHSGPVDTARTVAAAAGGRTGQFSVAGWSVSALAPAGNTPFTVVVASREKDSGTESIVIFVGILVAGVLAAGVLVTSVARSLSQPFAELIELADRVAKGDLNAQLERVYDGEAGRLGEAFNRMTSDLRKNLTALEQSHDDLRESLERIGDTLARTHDLEGLLQVVLETAVATLRAEAGVVLYGAPDQLRVVAEHRLAEAGLVAPTGIGVGSGVLGRVLATGDSVRGRLDSAGLTPARTEPGTGEILATPLRSMGVLTGVVALYGKQDTRPFDSADEDALRTLTGQASTAIDNVQLHQEAQRLSTTDGLTGLWNFRYLSMTLAREIERSTRFERPLAVLMLDLDHFKSVNDSYGHARGDSVLRELANRVQEQIREVDTFARYGGEEFVVVLPETTIDGAAQLAERVCLAVRRQPFRVDGEEPLGVTVSIGVAAFPQHGSSAATLMRAADRALYVAKHEGRDRWHVAGEEATAGVGH